MIGQTDQSNINHRHEELNITIQDTFILLTSAESMSLYDDKIEVFSSELLMDKEYFRNLGEISSLMEKEDTNMSRHSKGQKIQPLIRKKVVNLRI